MTKRERELEKKVAELEERIKKLEARPGGETHHHYHYERTPAPVYPSWPYINPSPPWWTQPVWCGSATGTAVGVSDGVFAYNAPIYGPEH